MKASIVVGLGYGDEGKGKTVSYLSKELHNPVVVRFSGGGQAGHTVISNDIKHRFSNFGAGSIDGVPTYFTEHTVIYPVTIKRELDELNAKGVNPLLIIHPLAKVVTPFDVFANRSDEGNLKDGSCGLGIGKTMKRNETPFKFYAVDLLNSDVVLSRLRTIRDNYYQMEETPEIVQEVLEFIDAVEQLYWVIRDYDFLYSYNNLIFEGSQGILLDMDYGIFPNVTYASTTSKNAHEVLDKLNINTRHLYYVSRSYHTRHGNGEFRETELNLVNNEEETNTLNEYQGKFKVGELDVELVKQALRYDQVYSNHYHKNFVLTCTDQLESQFDYSQLKDFITGRFYESYSPKTDDMKIRMV